MAANGQELAAAAFRERSDDLLKGWLAELANTNIRREELRSRDELEEECRTVLRLLAEVAQSDEDIREASWTQEVDRLARDRVKQGFAPEDTSNFLFALRVPLLDVTKDEANGQGSAALLSANALLDRVHNRMMSVYLRTREDVIARQQEEMLELSTPVVKLWKGVVAMPLIGTLDSRRAQVVMETLLERITETGSRIAIIDITGVPMVDTLVAQHLIKTVTAARLMGAECILSGIRPQIAQTIVQLGVNLDEILTKSTLADAFVVALERLGHRVEQQPAEQS